MSPARSSAAAPASSVTARPTRSSQRRGRPSAQAMPDAGAPGTRLSASKRSRSVEAREISSPARSVTVCPGASVHSIAARRPPSSVRARRMPPAGAVRRCTSSKTSGAPPRTTPRSRPPMTQGLEGGNRKAGWLATRSHAAMGPSASAHASCSSTTTAATNAIASSSGAVRRSGRQAVRATPPPR